MGGMIGYYKQVDLMVEFSKGLCNSVRILRIFVKFSF